MQKNRGGLKKMDRPECRPQLPSRMPPDSHREQPPRAKEIAADGASTAEGRSDAGNGVANESEIQQKLAVAKGDEAGAEQDGTTKNTKPPDVPDAATANGAAQSTKTTDDAGLTDEARAASPVPVKDEEEAENADMIAKAAAFKEKERKMLEEVAQMQAAVTQLSDEMRSQRTS